MIVFAATIGVSLVAYQGEVRQLRSQPIPAELNSLRAKPIERMHKPFRAIQMYSVKAMKAKFALDTKPEVDLRPKIAALGLELRDQGNRGTCSVHALTFLLEYMYRTRKNVAHKDLSEEYLNHMTNVATGTSGDGDFYSNIAIGYKQYGMVPEAILPYQPTYNPNQKVSAAIQTLGKSMYRFDPIFIKPWNASTGVAAWQLNLAITCLQADIPVAAGLRWPKQGSWQTKKVIDVEVMTPPPASGVFDGHSIALVGFKRSNLFPGGGYFVYRNSAGPNWWDGGYGYMSFAYLNQYANDLMVFVP